MKTRLSSLSEFLILWGISAAIGGQFLISTFVLAWKNDEYTHILLILPITATLIAIDWQTARVMSKRNLAVASVLLVTSILLGSYIRWWPVALAPDIRLFLGMSALVLWWVGAFVFCFGARVSRAFLFPLCFLFWIVPLPRLLLNSLIILLQQGSALAAHALFVLLGVPVAQDDLLLTIPGLTVKVAEECSSIRSSLMLLVTTLVLAQLLLRPPWRRALAVACALPLSVAKNGLRIFTIAFLGTRVDPRFLTGRLHHDGGVLFLTLALMAEFLLIWMLRRAEGKSPHISALCPVGSQAC